MSGDILGPLAAIGAIGGTFVLWLVVSAIVQRCKARCASETEKEGAYIAV